MGVRLQSSFRFAHEPVRITDSQFAGRRAELEELVSRLLFSDGGSFLVTGYRGVGKTSFVNQVIRHLNMSLPWLEEHSGPTQIVDVHISLARQVEPSVLMHYIVRCLYDRLQELGLFTRLPSGVANHLLSAYKRTTFNMVTKTGSSKSLTIGKETGLDSLSKMVIKSPFEYSFGKSRSDEMTFLGYDDRAAEYDIIKAARAISNGIPSHWLRRWAPSRSKKKWLRLKIVFIFDELDKLDQDLADSQPRYVDSILSTLKTLFTTSGICFIFVAGKDLHERLIEDVGHGDSIYESIFAYDKYLGCLWGDPSVICDPLVDTRAIDQQICSSCKESWRGGSMFCSTCGKYLRRDSEARDAYQDFLKFLAFRGRGIPRRIIRSFNSVVRWYETWPILAFTSEDRRVHRLYAELNDLLNQNHERLYPKMLEESPGSRVDRVRLAVAYMIDWMFQQGRNDFTADDLINSSKQLSSKIAPGERLSIQMVHELVDILTSGRFLEASSEEDKGSQLRMPLSVERPRRYRVPAHRLNALEGRAELLLPEDAQAIGGEKSLGRVGSYRLVSRLARGGMAIVYLAFDDIRGRQAVVKVIRPELISDSRIAEMFRHEAEVLRALRHPGIVQFYDAGVDKGTPYIVMEYIDGRDLASVMKSTSSLGSGPAIAIAARVADALAHVHQQRFLRNDVASRNIMLSKDGGVRILDFGISQRATRSAHMNSEPVAGTPAYMAPEQFRSHSDERSDVYALGIILYEMLAGRRPFRADTNSDWEKVKSSRPIPLREISHDVSQGLGDLVSRMLEPDPLERPQTMVDVRDSLLGAPGDFQPSELSDLVAKCNRVAVEADKATEFPLRSSASLGDRENTGEFTRIFARSKPPSPTPPASVPTEPGEYTNMFGPARLPENVQSEFTQVAMGMQPTNEKPNLRMFLQAVSGPGTQRKRFELGKITRLGRDLSNEIVLEGAAISRFHAEVRQVPSGRFLINDLNSSDGVFVNDVRVRQPTQLNPTSRVRIGDYSFAYDVVEESKGASFATAAN